MPGGFWTSETLRTRMRDIVDSFDEHAVVSCGYELSVGTESFVTGEASPKKFLKEGETVVIPPGQLALIITNETLKAPTDAIGFLSFKFSAKLRGLINVSGFHVDPGFQGKLIFSMYNAGVQTVHLSVGSKLFIVWFCSLDGATNDSYKGGHMSQAHLSDDAVTNLAARMPSPFTLEKDVLALRHELRAEIDKTQRILLVLITLVGAFLISSLHSCNQASPSTTTQAPPTLLAQPQRPVLLSPNDLTNTFAPTSPSFIPKATKP
jgi:dCTP deaminase